jgi:hypothetical protein
MQGKWEEMFGMTEEVAAQEMKVKKPQKKAVAKKEERKALTRHVPNLIFRT